MALPPRGDPRRPLHLAIRSTRILGAVGALIGSCVLVPLMMRLSGGRGVFAPTRTLLLGSVFYLAPGVLLLVFSVFMARRRFWAVVGALVVSSLAALFLVFVGVGLFMTLISTPQTMAANFAAGGAWSLFALAVGQLIFHLARSFEGIKHPPFGEELRGFEILPLAALAPPPPPPPRAGGARPSDPGDPSDGPPAWG